MMHGHLEEHDASDYVQSHSVFDTEFTALGLKALSFMLRIAVHHDHRMSQSVRSVCVGQQLRKDL